MTIPKRNKRKRRVEKGLPAPPFNKAVLDPYNVKSGERKTLDLFYK